MCLAHVAKEKSARRMCSLCQTRADCRTSVFSAFHICFLSASAAPHAPARGFSDREVRVRSSFPDACRAFARYFVFLKNLVATAIAFWVPNANSSVQVLGLLPGRAGAAGSSDLGHAKTVALRASSRRAQVATLALPGVLLTYLCSRIPGVRGWGCHCL